MMLLGTWLHHYTTSNARFSSEFMYITSVCVCVGKDNETVGFAAYTGAADNTTSLSPENYTHILPHSIVFHRMPHVHAIQTPYTQF